MVEPERPDLFIVQQCQSLSLSRSTFYLGADAVNRPGDPHPQHPIYPYLLKDMAITRPNQAWCADITCIPMRKGVRYLVAVMDWATRKVLARKLFKRTGHLSVQQAAGDRLMAGRPNRARGRGNG